MRPAKTFNHRLFKKKLKSFMQKGDEYGQSNTWLKVGKSEIYVRKWDADISNKHESIQILTNFSQRSQISVLDLATFRIHKSAQRQGHFKRVLKISEKLAKELGFSIVHIERVHNEVLPPYLESVGYSRLSRLDNCYAKNVPAKLMAA